MYIMLTVIKLYCIIEMGYESRTSTFSQKKFNKRSTCEVLDVPINSVRENPSTMYVYIISSCCTL